MMGLRRGAGIQECSSRTPVVAVVPSAAGLARASAQRRPGGFSELPEGSSEKPGRGVYTCPVRLPHEHAQGWFVLRGGGGLEIVQGKHGATVAPVGPLGCGVLMPSPHPAACRE